MRFKVTHTTRYTYPAPVSLGEHQLMLRPRDSHDLRLVDASLSLSPLANLVWQYDVFGNSVGHATFDEKVSELLIESTLVLERYPRHPLPMDVEPHAKTYPFVYPADVRIDLGALLLPEYLEDQEKVLTWFRRVIGDPTEQGWETLALLERTNRAIRDNFVYETRNAPGTQRPAETISRRAGSCRDFALLLMEIARALGFGARYVMGYLYSPELDTRAGANASGAAYSGAAHTHAWAEIYLPGAGWFDYDPTNAIVASPDLIRVATVRSPSQAAPIMGTYMGNADSRLDVSVVVEAM